jgi:hypothetical protein
MEGGAVDCRRTGGLRGLVDIVCDAVALEQGFDLGLFCGDGLDGPSEMLWSILAGVLRGAETDGDFSGVRPMLDLLWRKRVDIVGDVFWADPVDPAGRIGGETIAVIGVTELNGAAIASTVSAQSRRMISCRVAH